MFGYIFNNFTKGIYFNGLKYQKPITIVRRLCSELLGGAVDSFNVNSRALTCGSLLRNMLNKEVTLLGWVSDQKLTNSSLDLRDSYGVVRCVLPEEIIEKSINGQSLVEVLGVVALRPQSEVETFYANGDVDVHIHTLNILKSNVSIDLALKILKDNRFSLGNEISRSSKFSIRTHTCGDLRADHVGCTVTLCGWLKFWRSPHFLVLVDAYGSTQCIISAEGVEVDISAIPLESVLLVKGTVMKRPPEAANKKMATGDIEVAIKYIEILNPASELAFHVRQYQKPTDRISLHHRYLSLRFPEMQFNLRTRSDMINSMRKFLIDMNGFVEVETPTLFCRTPGGAREFLVPTKYKGEFYCLVQSPQQFKQMLMAGGIDRYFQVARCYRDESTRQDRQPEFTQLDIELSFTNRDGILNLTEELLVFSYPTVNLTKPFLRIPYFEALNKYGSDKPDISFNLNLTNISDFIKIPKDGIGIGGSCLVVRQSEGKLSNTFSKALKTNVSKQFPNVKLYHLRIPDVINDLESKHINDFIPNEKLKFFISENQLHKNDTIFLAFGTYEDACLSLGVCRTKIAKEFASNGTLQIIKENINKPLWITDFPLFVKGENGNIESCHHPFTAPCEEDIPLLSEDPLKVRALSYDLVINGYEIGGGSVRAHSPEMQEKLLDMLNIQPEPLAHLLRALRCGCPPHAGIALGLDRLTMLACGANSIRDVIAFPKSNEGKDPLSGAPNTVPEEELKYYHINVLQDKND